MTHTLAPRLPMLFHGGVPGLRPGDLITPRPPGDERHLVAGCSVCEARRAGSPLPYDRDHRFDRVYVTVNRRTARAFAAGYPAGIVYQVDPVGDLDPDVEDPEESFAVEAARVRVVLDLRVALRPGEERRLLRDPRIRAGRRELGLSSDIGRNLILANVTREETA